MEVPSFMFSYMHDGAIGTKSMTILERIIKTI